MNGSMNASEISTRLPDGGLDRLLAAADPASPVSSSALTAAALDALVDDARAAAPAGIRRRRRGALVVAVVAAASLVAGAAYATDGFSQLPYSVEIDGQAIEGVADADVVIPVTFTTRDGTVQSCTYSIAYFWGEREAIAEWVGTQDWSGLGQAAYERHLADPYYPESSTVIFDDGTEHEMTAEEIRASGPIFSVALDREFEARIPAELRDDEYVATGRTDCEAGAE